MANPQPTDAHLRMAHSIQEQLMVSDFTEQQRRILDLILRLSWGCGSKVAYIPRQNTFELVGIGENKIKGHLDWLIRAQVIGRQECYYWFNKDFDQWRVSRSFKYAPEKLAELVSFNIQQLAEKGRFVDENFPNREGETCRIGKNGLAEKGSVSDTNLASAKEILNKVLNKEVITEIVITGGEILEAPIFWEKVLTSLKEKVSPSNFDTWLKDTKGIGMVDSQFVIECPNNFVVESIKRRLMPVIEKYTISEMGKNCGIWLMPVLAVQT